MKKRLLAGLMAMCLVLTLLPASALAAEPGGEGTKDNLWDVSAEGNGNKVYAYLTENNSVEATYGDTVTLSLGGYTLHIEGTGAMKDFSKDVLAPWNDKKTDILAIEIADEVTSIGSGALSGATKLTTINGNNTKETGYIMFPAQLKNWGTALNKTSLSGELRFPEGCQLADPNYLNIYGNNNITGVDWTNYPLNSIMGHWTEYAFNGDPLHTALTNLGLDTIPHTVTNIGAYAFKNSYVTELEIPNTADVTYGDGTFVSSKVEDLTIDVSKEGSSLAEMMFQVCASLESVTFIGNELSEIPGGMFNGCINLPYLAIPYGVTTIETVNSANSIPTFGVGTSETNAKDFTVIFPSSLETIYHSSPDSINRVGLFANREEDKVKVLAPENEELWNKTIEVNGQEVKNVVGGFKSVGGVTYYTPITDSSSFYQYTLATEAICGDPVTVFSVKNSEGEACDLPEEFGTLSYEIENPDILSQDLQALSAGVTSFSRDRARQ